MKKHYSYETLIICLLIGTIFGIALGIFITYEEMIHAVNTISSGSNVQINLSLNETKLIDSSYDYLSEHGYINKSFNRPLCQGNL